MVSAKESPTDPLFVPHNATIDSVLQEQRCFPPSDTFRRTATLHDPEQLDALYRQAHADPVAFWADLARRKLHWHRAFSRTLNRDNAPFFRWFEDGWLNVSYNCLDRHLPARAQKMAIIAETEQGEVRRMTYAALHRDVCRFANVLKGYGVQQGDRVIIVMPHIPEAVIAMQACARIGAIHSVVFGGFSAEALKDRIADASASMVITADGGVRGGKTIALKAIVEKALDDGRCASVTTVVVLHRLQALAPDAGSNTQPSVAQGDQQHASQDHHGSHHRYRTVDWAEAMQSVDDTCEPTWVNAEHPLFLLYTSGSTGKPKGIQHASGGYLLAAHVTAEWVFDLRDDDIFWCTADVGWITGHSYVAYGPLACGATIVMYEGAPTVPHAGRFWEICQKHSVTIFYTAPTAIRTLMRAGDDVPARYDLESLRLLGTVGEPINPEAWMWYHRVIGRERCPIVDTWWQTETGAMMVAPIPGIVATKPGSCTKPLPGIDVAVVDDQGNPITDPNRGGTLVIRQPWPSMLRTIWNDPARYLSTYWARFDNRYYVTGDGAHWDNDGYVWIMGRIDDVLNVAGHRLGTMEIESALVAHPDVAEAAVVGRPDPIKGEGIVAFVVLKGERPADAQAQHTMSDVLRAFVTQQIGAIARPDVIRLTDGLPKTRSGKIMRRLLRDIARGAPITQDISTLENEGIVRQLQGL